MLPKPRFAASVILCGLLGACSEPTSLEEEILATIAQAEGAAEARDLGDLRRLIADDYLDERSHDKRQIEQMLRLLLLANQSIHLVVHVEKIDVQSPDAAEVVALVGMANTAERLPKVDLYQFDIRLARDSGDTWRVVYADWRRGLGKPIG